MASDNPNPDFTSPLGRIMLKKIRAALGVLLGHTVVVNAYIDGGTVYNKPGIKHVHYIGNVRHR